MLIRRLLICLLLLGSLLALPFWFRKHEGITPADENADRLVIITAHNKSVRDEYDREFRKYYREKFGKDIVLDFRSTGGTSDIMRYIEDRYQAAFRTYYEQKFGKWDAAYATVFNNDSHAGHPVRRLFMESDVSIGIDIFAGGGTFNQLRVARKGYAVDGKVRERHPEYFKEDSIPAFFGGEALYDQQGRYYGVVLSTFGILYNIDRMKEIPDCKAPETWQDLGKPEFFGKLVIADPSKSGSANKCFEIVIQQYMGQANDPVRGWRDGLNMIKRIFANARTVTDSASKVVRDVAIGEAAAGMAIDTYGYTEVEWSRRIFNGKSHVVYVTPKGGTAVSTDPVQILRGAPNRVAAERFVDFLLSLEGQKLHAFKMGAPGGGVKSSISRPAIRKELYAPEYRQYRFEADYDPYASGSDFVYHPQWTGRYYSLIQMVIKSVMLEVHEELQRAWQAIIAAGGPEKVPQAWACFNKLPFEYTEAAQMAKKLRISKENSAADVAGTLRQWSVFAKENYIKAAELAREGK